jgi:hypothetical protein
MNLTKIIIMTAALAFVASAGLAAKKTDAARPAAETEIHLVKKKQIAKAVEEARLCKQRSECGGPLYHCAIGCAVFVNQEKLLALKRLLTTYQQDCKQQCPTVKNYDCIKGKCQAIF